jgi:hypothetical protein
VTATMVASGQNDRDPQRMILLLGKWNTSGLSKEELVELEGSTKKLLGEVKLHNMMLNK